MHSWDDIILPHEVEEEVEKAARNETEIMLPFFFSVSDRNHSEPLVPYTVGDEERAWKCTLPDDLQQDARGHF